ncbi:hypothetical protein QBC32DRAFT_220730 [Pseudoneurospora amorphoporcata]|uniref:Uncharacterized protein n=1 Tax=Pseudoneurospora amorphoporcata TaxID=241081 RepID=A0AAN6SDH6_9PEZI|nr:hypothetical protein QBC32DRAFT_220730 [Pseudoneurospora amorphoporcata]
MASRLFRPMRSLMASRRLSKYVVHGQPMVVQGVRIKHGSFRRRMFRVVGMSILAYVCIDYYDRKVLGMLSNALDDLDAGRGHSEENDEEEDYIFIPFPLTEQKLKPEPYSARSTEWKEFVKFAQDQKRIEQVQGDIASLVLKMLKNQRILTNHVGPDMTVKKAWLQAFYPLVAPPEYERYGVMITPYEIGWASISMESPQVKKAERLFWPKPVALSLWAVATTLAKKKAMEVSQFFGLSSIFTPSASTVQPAQGNGTTGLPSTVTGDVQRMMDQIRRQATQRPEDVQDPGALVSARRMNPEAATQNKGILSTANQPPPSKETPKTGDEKKDREWALAQLREFIGLSPWEIFTKTYRKVWKPIRPDPPRGSMAFAGMIEFETKKHWLTAYVTAWYNPGTRTFDPNNFTITVTRLTNKQVHPLVR